MGTGFRAVSPEVGIRNTSYRAQIGVIGDQWYVRVIRGKTILAEVPITELMIDHVLGAIYGNINLPFLNQLDVANAAARLMQFARRFATSGVAPKFPDDHLVYQDGTKPSGEVVETPPPQPRPDFVSHPQAPQPQPSTVSSPAASEPTAQSPFGVSTESSEDYYGVPETEIDLSDVGLVNASETKRIIGSMPTSYAKDLEGRHLHQSSTLATLLMSSIAYISERFGNEEAGWFVGRFILDLIKSWSFEDKPLEIISGLVNYFVSMSPESEVVECTKEKCSIAIPECILKHEMNVLLENEMPVPLDYPCTFCHTLLNRITDRIAIKGNITRTKNGCTVDLNLE